MYYGGAVTQQDMTFIRSRMKEKGLSETELNGWPKGLALNFKLFPGYLGVRGLARADGFENVTMDGKTWSPYNYSEIAAYGFPLTVWLDMKQRSISAEGRDVIRVENKGLIAGILASWGSYEYASRRNVAASVGNTGTLAVFSPFALSYPSRWFFTGTKGSYWNGPLFLFGHVSSDTSDAVTFLGGQIPIRYSNREKPGTR